jgi:thiol-disulfide isomerase/thioredoxin
MKTPAVTSLETEDDLDVFLNKKCKCLIVVDVHPSWCGRCKALTPMMEEMMIEYDQSEERLAFASLEINKLSAKLHSMVHLPPYGVFISKADAVNESNRLCKSPLTKEEFYTLVVDRKSCCPLFLVMKSNQLIAILEGADLPTIKKFVHDYIPPLEMVHETE